MPKSLPGKSTHSGRAPAGAQSFRFETSQEPHSIFRIFSGKRVVCNPPDDQKCRLFRNPDTPLAGWALLARRRIPLLLEWVAPLAPIADAAVHGNDVGVSHLLQVIGCQRGTEAAATIEHERSSEIGILALNVALDDAFAQVDGSGQVVGVEFAVFADVDENEFVSAIEPGFEQTGRPAARSSKLIRQRQR